MDRLARIARPALPAAVAASSMLSLATCCVAVASAARVEFDVPLGTACAVVTTDEFLASYPERRLVDTTC